MRIYIFGYASLLSAKGVNDHNLGAHYEETDLHPAKLLGYKREWNAVDSDGRGSHPMYLGLVKDAVSHVNGVLFQIDIVNLPKFFNAESIGRLYDLVEVTDDIVDADGDTMPIDGSVYTCITISPMYSGLIADSYMKTIDECLNVRGDDFKQEFFETCAPLRGKVTKVEGPVPGRLIKDR